MSNQRLLEQIRNNRRFKVTVGKFTFICRRPTDVEAGNLHKRDASFAEIAEEFVVDWGDNVMEDDVVGGGVMTAVPFDRELWREWCTDRPDFWVPIANGVLEQYQMHSERMKSVPKA